jgi:hypothetical protein
MHTVAGIAGADAAPVKRKRNPIRCANNHQECDKHQDWFRCIHEGQITCVFCVSRKVRHFTTINAKFQYVVKKRRAGKPGPPFC